MIEVEIANLIKNTKFNVSDRSDDCAGRCTAWDEAGPSQQLADANNEGDGTIKGTGIDLNGTYYERPTWNSDIKVYDPERLADATSSAAARLRRRVIIGVAIALTLGIAWSGRWYSSQSTRAALSSVPVEHKVASLGSGQPISTVPASAVDAPQQGIPTLLTNEKTDSLPTSGPSGQRASNQKVVPPVGADKRVAVALPQNTTPSSASAAVHRRPKISPTPFPETKPTTVDGWVVHEVTNGTAVLQGPNGVWKAARGDTVPGLGRVDSVILWGNRWIVSTSRGLITTQ